MKAEEWSARRRRLKVFLGYSSGVGKTLTTLDKGRRRHQRGQDVVIGAIQEKRPPETDGLLSALASVPMRRLTGKPCIHLDAVLRRRPGVCLIDGLAWNNPPGAQHAFPFLLNLRHTIPECPAVISADGHRLIINRGTAIVQC